MAKYALEESESPCLSHGLGRTQKGPWWGWAAPRESHFTHQKATQQQRPPTAIPGHREWPMNYIRRAPCPLFPLPFPQHQKNSLGEKEWDPMHFRSRYHWAPTLPSATQTILRTAKVMALVCPGSRGWEQLLDFYTKLNKMWINVNGHKLIESAKDVAKGQHGWQREHG